MTKIFEHKESGIRVPASSKGIAWCLIRAECQKKKLNEPLMCQVKEFKKL